MTPVPIQSDILHTWYGLDPTASQTWAPHLDEFFIEHSNQPWTPEEWVFYVREGPRSIERLNAVKTCLLHVAQTTLKQASSIEQALSAIPWLNQYAGLYHVQCDIDKYRDEPEYFDVYRFGILPELDVVLSPWKETFQYAVVQVLDSQLNERHIVELLAFRDFLAMAMAADERFHAWYHTKMLSLHGEDIHISEKYRIKDWAAYVLNGVIPYHDAITLAWLSSTIRTYGVDEFGLHHNEKTCQYQPLVPHMVVPELRGAVLSGFTDGCTEFTIQMQWLNCAYPTAFEGSVAFWLYYQGLLQFCTYYPEQGDMLFQTCKQKWPLACTFYDVHGEKLNGAVTFMSETTDDMTSKLQEALFFEQAYHTYPEPAPLIMSWFSDIDPVLER